MIAIWFLFLGVSIPTVLSIPPHVPHPHRCPVHQFYNESATTCVPERTCQVPFPEAPCDCIDECDPRCECCAAEGFIRDEVTGKCIPESQCPCANCGCYEVCNDCASSCVAEPTCQNPSPTASYHCKPITISRCECDASSGYIRDEVSGECVLLEHCPCQACGPHEVYNTCASSCTDEPTCQEPSPSPHYHCLPNTIARCECDASSGYIRDAETGLCVLSSQCPCNDCGCNEVFNSCASSCLPEPTCQNPSPVASLHCWPETIGRCECDAENGYIRDENTGLCILACECPCCEENEVYNTCASSCLDEPTCQNPSPVASDCCEPETIARCECDAANGFIRDAVTGKCIPSCECPCCNPNEVRGCKPCCETTCQNPHEHNCLHPCPKICIEECICEHGFLRDELTGLCVPKAHCPPHKIHKPLVHKITRNTHG